MLRKARRARKMPTGWRVGDDPHARYAAVGIRLSDRVLRVSGPIMR